MRGGWGTGSGGGEDVHSRRVTGCGCGSTPVELEGGLEVVVWCALDIGCR